MAVCAAGTRATANANAVSGSSAISVPNASMPKPNHTQLTSGLTTTSTFADCCRLVLRQHDVEVLGERAPDRDLGRRLVLVLPEEPARRIHLRQLGAVAQHGHVRRDHLLAAVVGDRERVEADDVVADGHRLAGLQRARLVLLESATGEAEEQQDDADVDDVAAVAPLVAADETDRAR